MNEFIFQDRLDYAIRCWFSRPPKKNQNFSTFKDQHNLTTDEFLSLFDEAKNGDSGAAFRIAMFYRLTKRDNSEADKWLALAASLGHSTAQYSLASNLLDIGDLAGAKIWAIKSQFGGNNSATQLIEEINSVRPGEKS